MANTKGILTEVLGDEPVKIEHKIDWTQIIVLLVGLFVLLTLSQIIARKLS